MIEIVTIETPSLGDRSYLVHDGVDAFVVDPQRDIERVLEAVSDAGVRLTHVFETHVHNDYVSGGLALARRTGATAAMAADDDVAFDRLGVHHGDELAVGTMTVRAVHTPGHTHTHLSYVVAGADGHPVAVFTGGSLLYGTVGRTDLLGDEHTDALTRAQYRTARSLVDELPDDVAVHPTHGFGSFCASAGGGERRSGTIGDERVDNLAITVDHEDEFVERLLAGLTDHPAYYAHMALLNRAGPLAAEPSTPVPVDADELRRRLAAGEWVVDLRRRRMFAADHLAGSIGIELADAFVTYVGWLVPWGSRITLLAQRAEDVAAAQLDLARIGLDQLGGAAVGPFHRVADGLTRASHPVADFGELAAALAGPDPGRIVVVDVRRADEHRDAHVAGAHSLPLHQLVDHHHHVPDGELWVHCTSGYRASIAASLLGRAGYPVVLVDDEFDGAERAGVRIVRA